MASRTIAAYVVGRTSRQDSVESGTVPITVSSDPSVLAGSTPGGSPGGSALDTAATAPVLRAFGQGRQIVLRWDRQTNLTSFAGYELQVSDDAITWYQLDNSGLSWRGTAGLTTAVPTETYTHTAVPLAGSTDRPASVTLRYRVRRCTRQGAAPGAADTVTAGRGPWSGVIEASAGAITAGELAADIVTAAKVDPAAFLRGIDTGLIALWSFDEGVVAGAVRGSRPLRYTDSSGEEHHGAPVGAQAAAQASATSPAAVSGAGAAFAAGSALEVPADDAFWAGADWTISMWLRSAAPVGRPAAVVLEYRLPLRLPQSGIGYSQLGLRIFPTGRLHFYGLLDSPGPPASWTGEVWDLTVTRGPPDWVHVAVSKTGRAIDVWVNGVRGSRRGSSAAHTLELPAGRSSTLTRTAVATISVTARGAGYTSAPAVAITGGGGSGAAATATIAGGAVTAVTITHPGRAYTSAPAVTITGGGGSGAAATATIAGGRLRIGSAATSGYRYDGELDEVRLYDRGLTEAEIKFLYLVPGGPTPSMLIADRIIAGSITAEHLAVGELRSAATRTGTLEVSGASGTDQVTGWGVGKGLTGLLRTFLTADEVTVQRRVRATESWSDRHTLAQILSSHATVVGGNAASADGVRGGGVAVYNDTRTERLILHGGDRLTYQVRPGSSWVTRCTISVGPTGRLTIAPTGGVSITGGASISGRGTTITDGPTISGGPRLQGRVRIEPGQWGLAIGTYTSIHDGHGPSVVHDFATLYSRLSAYLTIGNFYCQLSGAAFNRRTRSNLYTFIFSAACRTSSTNIRLYGMLSQERAGAFPDAAVAATYFDLGSTGALSPYSSSVPATGWRVSAGYSPVEGSH